MAHVEMAAPDPLALPFRQLTQQRRRLRIVDEDQIGFFQRRPQPIGVGHPNLSKFASHSEGRCTGSPCRPFWKALVH